MKIRFRYTYLKTLYRKYKKLHNTATYKGVRDEVKKEMSIVIMSAKSDSNKRKYNSSNKHLRHISESVRKFLIDKIAKERIEKK